MSTILTGKKITVTFTHPMALQIDGETVKNVTTYTVEA
jgi:diacylglycerol kinase family enzyme